MPFGGIRWRSDSDKEGFDEILPMSKEARQAVDRYLSKNPRLGEAWLFPSPKDDAKPIRRDLAGRWLLKAEKMAGLPKLRGGAWHPFRRLWATERKHLPDRDVAVAGGWQDTRSLKLSYQHTDPETVLKVVSGGG
jgi:integrase